VKIFNALWKLSIIFVHFFITQLRRSFVQLILLEESTTPQVVSAMEILNMLTDLLVQVELSSLDLEMVTKFCAAVSHSQRPAQKLSFKIFDEF
jgi:hypothetical protein